MEFDYFYGLEDAEQYQFYRIPKLLITSEQFKDVSVESKLLYGLMLDRLSLSIKNGWFDALNRAYIIYTIEDVTEDMHSGSQKAVKLVAELEKKAGLIKKKRQGLGKPSLFYVLKFSTVCPQKTSESQFKNGENHNSGNVRITTQESPNSQPNNTNQNQTENNETDLIHLSVNATGMDRESDGMREDPIAKRKSYERYFREHLYIDDEEQKEPG
ncbi:MAG: replication initiator protein A [Blautia sp.]|nr:replication initiator protein A [Blautia sp.]